MNTPLISVIMPVYNNSLFIRDAIESILNQTVNDFELIIIDDFSKDDTVAIISTYKDKRIKLIKHAYNQGTALSINEGINISSGKYIARMDGDDRSYPYRFEKQLEYLNNHPEISICGSHMNLIDTLGNHLKTQNKKLGNDAIKMGLFFGETSIAHPSIFIQKEKLDQKFLRYDSAFRYAEDYDFYCRASHSLCFDNLNEPLIEYRLHDNSVSMRYCDEQRQDAQMALYLHLRRLKVPFLLDEFKIHSFLHLPSKWNQNITLEQAEQWIKKLVSWNCKNQVFNSRYFKQQAELRLQRLENGLHKGENFI